RDIAIAIDHGIKEAAEGGHLVGGASHTAIHHVKDTGADDDQSRIEKHARIGLGGGIAEQNCRHNIDDQSNEGEYIGRDARQRQAANNGMQQYSASPSKSASPGHSASS